MLDISIVTYNSSKWLHGFFDSLINQNYPVNFLNLYITDNGSSDDTLDILKQYERKLLFNSIIIDRKDNLGFGNGHNNNIQKCQSQFILVTNVDIKFEADSLVTLINVAENDNALTASWEMRQKPYEHPKLYNPVTLETSWSSSACILFRRESLVSVGGYEPRIFMYGEDVELSWRLRAFGYILRYVPSAVCWHYTYEDSFFKKTQFLGSTLANLYIRTRYGSFKQVLGGIRNYIRLFFSKPNYSGQRLDLFYNFVQYLRNFKYFRSAQFFKKMRVVFHSRWDYEFIRDGAFYSLAETNLTKNPLVSVIVRTYQGRAGFLKECLISIKNQTYKNIETIIVEDGGNTLSEIPNEIELANYRFFALDKVGRCVAGNHGLVNAIGDYLIFLDDDDLFYSDHIEVLITELIKNPQYSAAYTNAFAVPTKIISRSIDNFHYVEGKYSLPYMQPFNRMLMWVRNYIPIQSILFSRKLYDELGGFDLDLENLEDWNLWTRYSLNHEFVYLNKTTSLYRLPFDEDVITQRQDILDSYYRKAVEKQKDMYLNVDVYSFHKYSEQRISELLGIPENNVQKTLTRINNYVQPVKIILRSIFKLVSKLHSR